MPARPHCDELLAPTPVPFSHGRITLLLALAAYLIYRRVQKPVRDKAMQSRTATFMHKYPYFRTQKLVLEFDEM